MKFKILICLIFLGIFNAIGQKKITGTVFRDSTMLETLPKVKVRVIYGTNLETIKTVTDNNGSFKICLKNTNEEFKIVIERRGYIPIIIQHLTILDIDEILNIKLLLKPKLSLHDEDYEGTSKVIQIERF